MNKKSLLLLFCVGLFGCGNEGNISSLPSFGDELSNDCAKLVNNKDISAYRDEMPFGFEAYRNNSLEYSGYYVVTIVVKYANTRIDNIKIISIPNSTELNRIDDICSVGYNANTTYCLNGVEEINTEDNYCCFKGYKLSYLTKIEDDVRVSVKGKDSDKEIDCSFMYNLNEINE